MKNIYIDEQTVDYSYSQLRRFQQKISVKSWVELQNAMFYII